jgi:hypothetical protein
LRSSVAQSSATPLNQPQKTIGKRKKGKSKKRKSVERLNDMNSSRGQLEILNENSAINHPAPETESHTNQSSKVKSNGKNLMNFSLDVFGIENPSDKDARIIGNIISHIQSNQIARGRLEVDQENPEEAWLFFRSISRENRKDQISNGKKDFSARELFLNDSINQLWAKSQSWVSYWEHNYGICFKDYTKSFKNIKKNKRFFASDVEKFLILFLFYVDMFDKIIAKNGKPEEVDQIGNSKPNHIKQALESFEKICQTLGILSYHDNLENSAFEFPKNSLHPNQCRIRFSDPNFVVWSCLEQWAIGLDNQSFYQILFLNKSVMANSKRFFNDIFCYSIRNLNHKMFPE